MSPLVIVLVVLAPLVAIPFFLCLISFLLSFASGWQRLAGTYAAAGVPSGRRFSAQSGSIGAVSYRNCLTVHVAADGLFLSVPFFLKVGHVPLFIPWTAVHDQEAVKFLWHETVRFNVGQPTIVRIHLPKEVLGARVAPA